MKDQRMPQIIVQPMLNDFNYQDWKFFITNNLISFDWFKFLNFDFEDDVLNDDKFKQINRFLLAIISTLN